MKTYTLQELAEIASEKFYLNRDRFIHYFTSRHNYSEQQAKDAYKVFASFPRLNNPMDYSKLDEIIPKALEIIRELRNNWDIDYKLGFNNSNKELKKFIYKKQDEILETIINLHSSSDIIDYADLLKLEIEPICLLDFCCTINYKNSKETLDVFEGDLFDSRDEYYGANSNVYIAQKNDKFKKLIYSKGKGYLHRGELNIDDGNYNSYVLGLNEWIKIGNVNTDLIKLTDDGKLN